MSNLAQYIAYAKFSTTINAAVFVDFLILNNQNLTSLVEKIEIETTLKKYLMHWLYLLTFIILNN